MQPAFRLPIDLCRAATFRGIALAAMMVVAVGSVWSEPVSREERIKAALIFKLVKFVDWSAQALPAASPLQFCTYGSSGIAESLSAADGKPVRDRMAKHRRLDALAVNDLKGCHVVFLAAGSREIAGGVPQWLKARGSGMLTISDQADFARRGGMIGLTQGDNKVGFEINLRATREGGMEPGTPLLELATIVD